MKGEENNARISACMYLPLCSLYPGYYEKMNKARGMGGALAAKPPASRAGTFFVDKAIFLDP
jgi:hypothetical protein